MPAALLTVEIRLPAALSLKDKRQVLRHLLDTARHRYGVAVAELDLQDLRQRSILGFAAVSGEVAHVEEILDRVLQFVWSHPELEVVDRTRTWTDDD